MAHSRERELTLVSASRIVTNDGPDAEAMLLFGDRVVSTGSFAAMKELAPSATSWAYPGATVVPGFNDAHQHLTMMAAQSRGLDLSGGHLDSPGALAREIATYAATLAPGDWLVASRYDHMRSGEGVLLTRHELDALAPDHPAVLVNVGAHGGVANSRALSAAGLDDDSADPPGGALGRDGGGRLDGRLFEQPLFDLVYPSLASGEPVAPVPSPSSLLGAIRTSADLMLASGITSVGDAMVGPRELELLQLARDDGMPLRVNALLTFPHLSTFSELGLRDGFGDEWLRVGGIKAFVDGAVAGRSCAVAEPFENSDDLGIVTTTRAELQSLVDRATSARTRLAIHANGERAIEMVLDAFEDTSRRHPGAIALRHRIEHCTLVTPQILRRMARLNVIAVPFGSYVHFHGDKLIEWYGHDRLERMFAHRAMLDHGITVAGSSDYPCGPWEPLLGLQSCVTRRTSSGLSAGASQRVSLREAIGIYTVGSATASGEDHIKGRLAPGYLADFAVLDGDVLRAEPDGLAATRVLSTWVGGVERWQAPS